MNRQKHIRIGYGLILAGVLAGSMAYAAPGDGERFDFDRYQVILDRKPFGNPPPPPPPPPPGPKFVDPANSWAKNFRMSSIKKDNSGRITVGLVDNSTQASLMIDEGTEDRNSGITVVSADYEKEEAILRMGDEEVPMSLTGMASAPARKSTSKSSSKKSFASKFTPVVTRRSSSRSSSRTTPIKRPQPRYTGEELKKHLQEYNMEVIRKGLPALPIQLTPDQDSQLVNEGILPKQ